MVAVDDILTSSLASVIQEWFEPPLDHPFFNVHTITVTDKIKPIPKRWMDEVRIDEGLFRADEGDFFDSGFKCWSAEEGKQRFREGLKRLEIDEATMSHPSLERMNRHELGIEKRRVKQELKRYDADFRKQFSRLPTHTEKEPMRPLYVYYRKLKAMITQAESSKQGRRHGDEGGHRFGPSLATIPDLEETPQARMSSQTNNVEDQITALEARIESLQSEKSQVRIKLQAFQEKFVSENSRKIRFHKDILPIEREYRLYKNLKEDITKMESQLRDLKAEL